MTEELRISYTTRRVSIVIVIALIIHLLFVALLVYRHEASSVPLEQQLPDDVYLAHQLLSAGQHQASVHFQHEAPSDEQTEQAQLPVPNAQEAEHKPEQSPTDMLPEERGLPAPRPQQQRVTKPRPARQRTNNRDRTKLMELTRGFLQSMQQEAGHNRAAVKDIKQLALQMYTSKIWHIIKQSFLAEDNSIHLSRPVQAHTQLLVTIDKEGRLTDIRLLYPQHMTELRLVEHLIVSRAQKAGLFPPLPANIGSTSKSFSFPLYIKGEAGVHTYSLSYH